MNATLTYEQRTGSPSPFLFIVAIIVLIVISAGAVVVGKYSHGNAKHADAPLVRACLKDRGTRMQWQSGLNKNRYIFICNFGDGRYGFQVAEVIGDKLEEITAYIKHDQTLQNISNNLKSAGARCMKGCLP